MKLHAAVARVLRENGVKKIFGILGDANMKYVVDFIDLGGDFVNSVSEGSAVSMADGYSRMSGEVAIASVTHGPGVTNTLTAMTEAVRAHTPLVLLTGDTPPLRNMVQYIDLNAVAQVCGAQYRAVLAPEHLVDDLANVLQATAILRHPTILDIRYDLLDRDVDYVSSRFRDRSSALAIPDEESFDVALGIIASADRPVVLAGRGAIASQARSELILLADVLDAPLATTLLAKDLFRGEPYNLGIAGTLSHDVALRAILEADCVIAFGASLNSYTTAERSLIADKVVVQCDMDRAAIGRFAPVDSALIGDAKCVANILRERLESVGTRSEGSRSLRLREELARISPRDGFVDKSSADTLDVRSVMIKIDELLPANRAVVTDTGRFMRSPWLYMHVSEPGSFQHTVNFGSIGLGIATAIGASEARTDRLTVAVAGDGGTMMGLIELSTAARRSLPLVVVVLNDGSYGAEYSKLQTAGYDPKHALIDWPDLAEVARSLGVAGATVTSWRELEAAVERATAGEVPILIDIKIDPAVDIGILG